jgi:hypothetical protein
MTDPLSSCKQCGNLIRHDDRFCPRCGTPQGDPARTGSLADQPAFGQHQTSPPLPSRAHSQKSEVDASGTLPSPEPPHGPTFLVEYGYRTGEEISEQLGTLLRKAAGCPTPDLVVNNVEEALSILRFYELDALSPHIPYPVDRWQRAQNDAQGAGTNWVEGGPNPAKLLGILDQARQYIEQWNSIPQASAMQHLRAELATETDVRMGRWLAKRLRITRELTPAWKYIGVFVSFGTLLGGCLGFATGHLVNDRNMWIGALTLTLVVASISLVISILIRLTRLQLRNLRYAAWRSGRMKRWNDWLRSQGLNP